MTVISVEEERAKRADNIHRAHRCAAKLIRPLVGKEVRLTLKEPVVGKMTEPYQCTIVGVDKTGVTFSPGFGEKFSTQRFGNIKQVEFS